MNDRNFGPHLKEVLKKQCKIVGAKYSEIDFKSDRWYMEYSWTEEVQDGFKEWMVNYLYKNNPAQRELLERTNQPKKRLREAVRWFLFSYGWTVRDTCGKFYETEGNKKPLKRSEVLYEKTRSNQSDESSTEVKKKRKKKVFNKNTEE